MVTLFATKMAGGSDDDDVILASLEAFEQDGGIDGLQVNLPENHQKIKIKSFTSLSQPSTKTSTTTFLHEDSHTFCEKSSTTTDNAIRSIVKKHLGIWLFGKYDSGKILNI